MLSSSQHIVFVCGGGRDETSILFATNQSFLFPQTFRSLKLAVVDCVTHCLANKQTGLNNGETGLGLVVVHSVSVEAG